MSYKTLLTVSIKAKVLPHCELDNDGSEYQYVDAFLDNRDSDKLIEQSKLHLSEIGLELSEIIKIGPFDPDSINNDDPLMVELLIEAADKAKETGNFIFGPFTSSKIYD